MNNIKDELKICIDTLEWVLDCLGSENSLPSEVIQEIKENIESGKAALDQSNSPEIPNSSNNLSSSIPVSKIEAIETLVRNIFGEEAAKDQDVLNFYHDTIHLAYEEKHKSEIEELIEKWEKRKDSAKAYGQATLSQLEIELEQHIAKLEYQLSEINEHGLGDSDTALTKWTIERDLKILRLT